MYKVNNKDTRTCKINDNINNKVTFAAVLISLLLTLNIFLFTKQISFVSCVILPVYPSGPIFERKWMGWGIIYTCGAYIQDINIWEAYIRGGYIWGQN